MFQFSLLFMAKGVFYFNNRCWNQGKPHAAKFLKRRGGRREREWVWASVLSCKFPNSSTLILLVFNPTLKTVMIAKGVKYYLDHALLTACPGLTLVTTSNFNVCVCVCVCTRTCMCALGEKHQCSLVPFHNGECVKGKEFGGTRLLPVGRQLDRCFQLTFIWQSFCLLLNVRKG